MTNFYDDLDGYGDSVALITQESEHVSYLALAEAADALGEQFSGRCLIFCLPRNDLESVVGYLAALRSKVVPVLVSPDIHPNLLRKLIAAYRPKYIWLPKDNVFGLDESIATYSYGGYDLLKMPHSIDYPLHENLGQLLTTSGSTGSPKLVRHSYININNNAHSIAQYLKIDRSDRPITTLPMSYTYGLSIMTSHLLRGCAIILNNHTLMEKSFWEMLKSHAATTFGGVPYIYEMLKKLRFSRMELPSLRLLTQAGGKLSQDIAGEFASICEAKGISLVIMYGQTEATARMSYLPSEYLKSKSSSIGIPIPGGNFWLEDKDGKVISDPNIVGELVYSGLNVCMGYSLGFADLYKGDEMNNVLRTGDMATRDEDGFYYIVGRKARFLKLFGKRISLDEAEQLLRGAGFECACSGRDDKMNIYAVGAEDPLEAIRVIVESTGIPSAGFKVISVECLPRNEAGKILYERLEQESSSKS